MKIRRLLLFALMLLPLCMQAQNKDIKDIENMNTTLQLYSIRDVIGDSALYAKNHAKAFKALHDMGYTAVEAANYKDGKFYGVSPEQFRSDVKAAGLIPLSSHAGYTLSDDEITRHDFSKALKWWDVAIDAHKNAGMKYIIVPWASTPKSLREGQVLCDYYNAVGEKCRKAGLLFGYHTHSHEYQKVDGETWINYMMQHISSENMFWQMDVYWAVMAQQSPVEWFHRYPGRFRLLHIKDKYEVGQSGMVNFEAIFRNAKLAGLEDYVIELENTDGTISSMEGVKRSAEYIHNLLDVLAKYLF